MVCLLVVELDRVCAGRIELLQRQPASSVSGAGAGVGNVPCLSLHCTEDLLYSGAPECHLARINGVLSGIIE